MAPPGLPLSTPIDSQAAVWGDSPAWRWVGPPKRCCLSPQAQLIAQAIGQAFAVAYSQFLRESGIDPSQVGTQQSQGATGPGHLHNGDLDHFSNSENCREVSK